jgi:hypothetical protein
LYGSAIEVFASSSSTDAIASVPGGCHFMPPKGGLIECDNELPTRP